MNRIVLLGLLAVAACGDPVMSFDAYPAARLNVVCEYLVRCGVTNSIERCRETRSEAPFDADLIAAVDAGIVRWHGDAAEDCLDRIEQASCDRTSESYRYLGCERLFTGTLGNGEACTMSTECISRECWTEGCTEACCVGYCAGEIEPVIGEIGGPCRLSGCVAGARCEDSVCVSLLAEGQACEWDMECAYELGCNQGRCETLGFSGDRCTSSTECRMVGDGCGPQGVCALIGELGAPCLKHSHCGDRLMCGTSGLCAPGPAIGQRCDFTHSCFDRGAICDLFTGTCALLKLDGVACTYSEQCESRYCFDDVCVSCGN